MPTALVIDDDRSTCELIRRTLTKIDIETTVTRSFNTGLEFVTASAPDVVLLDIVLPGISGLEVFQTIRQIDKKLPVIFITASDSSDVAIEAMQLGGFEYVTKPLDLPSLNDIVRRAIATRRMMSVPVALSVEEGEEPSADAFIGRSPAMLDVFKSIGRVAAQNVPVLIRGESGTGKELVARALYQFSDRRNECFMAINCAALPHTLLESELFGHEKGAFTGADKRRVGKFEACHGGTIFLDEVGDMAPLVQSKVLRLLQDQKFERVGGNQTIETDVRLITATNRPLESMVQEGSFREDLLYRLNDVTINLPPLRERANDVELLLEHYLRLSCEELRRSDVEGISPEALEVLNTYEWPGNVRQLRSVVRQTLLNATGPVIVPSFLPHEVRSQASSEDEPATATTGSTEESDLPPSDLAPFVTERLAADSTDLYAEAVESMERYLITRVLQHTAGNQTRAAEVLGITRGKIRDRIKNFGISMDKSVTLED